MMRLTAHNQIIPEDPKVLTTTNPEGETPKSIDGPDNRGKDGRFKGKRKRIPHHANHT